MNRRPALLNLGTVVYSIGTMAPDIVNASAWATEALSQAVTNALTAAVNDVATEATSLLARPSLITRFFQWLQPLAQGGANQLNLAGAKISSFFKNAATFIKGITGVFAAAAFAISVWSLVADIQAGADAVNLVFDAVQVALTGVMLACAILAIIPIADIAAGIIGAVAAVLSGVLAFAQFLYNYLSEPSGPVADFMNKLVNPLIESLNDPPPGWSPPQPAGG